MTSSQLKNIHRPDAVYIEGLKIIARRERSVSEVRTRLLKKGYQSEDVESAISQLIKERALNDHRTAHTIVQRAVQVKNWPKQRIKNELTRRGIMEEIATNTVEEAFSDISDRMLLDKIIDQRLSSGGSDDRQLQRLYQSLLRRGFSSEDVTAALETRLHRLGLVE